MKTVLTAINAKYIHSNLAVYCLRAYAKPYQEQIEIAEYTINKTDDEILMDLYQRKPDILCFSCYIWNIAYVEKFVHEIKKLLPDVILWLGGPEVSYDAKKVVERLPEITGVMMGEGEATFLELMQHYQENTISLKDIKGITYREKAEIIEHPWRETIDLSTVPFVYHNLEQFQNKIIYYESSRGCPFSCSYCLSSVDKCLRFRDTELVKKELLYFLEHKIPQVKFVDRTFNCNHKHAMEIWNFIKEHDNGITNFHFEVAADLLNEAEIACIKEMRPGLIQLEIGVQSTNEKTINEIKRKMDFNKVTKVVTTIHEFKNTHQHLDLIAGLPYENLQSFQISFDNVYSIHPEQLQLGFLKVLKGSYMESQKDRYGLVYHSQPPYEVLYTKWLSYDDVLQLKGIEEMVETYYNSGQFSSTIRYLESAYNSPFIMYQELSDFYKEKGYDQQSHGRIARYEILHEFIKTKIGKDLSIYESFLTYDLYLRENVKNRPSFAGEYSVQKDELFYLYDDVFPKHEALALYSKKNMRKMMHIEKFAYDVTSNGEPKEIWILFDYQKREPLHHQATTILFQA